MGQALHFTSSILLSIVLEVGQTNSEEKLNPSLTTCPYARLEKLMTLCLM